MTARAHILLAVLAGATVGPAAAQSIAPDWQMAACRMEAICQDDGRCLVMEIPGATALFRDGAEIKIGPDAAEAQPVAHYPTRLEAELAVAGGAAMTMRSIIVIGAEDQGPGWLRVALYRVTDDGLAPRHTQLLCETSAGAGAP